MALKKRTTSHQSQHFALQWVQSYINLFGGNASQVTISGESAGEETAYSCSTELYSHSAGGGSVMLQDMAYGGSQGTALFVNVSALQSRSKRAC